MEFIVSAHKSKIQKAFIPITFGYKCFCFLTLNATKPSLAVAVNVIKLRNNIIKQHADFADFNIFYNLFLQKSAESAGK
jgi:hypothetical protein